MLSEQVLRPPFFEVGPKSYLVGEEVLELALAADRASAEHGVQVIFTAPLTELARVAARTENLVVCAPHMDPLRPGRGLAEVLPEAVRAAGASAVMLNHSERPLAFAVLEQTVRRAEEVGLMSVVCAGSLAEIEAVARLAPDVIVAEPAELIGTGNSADLAYLEVSARAIREINPSILVLQAAGITDGEDVYRVITAGADGTGSSSGIARAPDRGAMVHQMVAAARRGWDARHRHQTEQRKEA